MGVIVDMYGEPYDQAELTRELPQASLTGIRQVWQGTVAGGMTPEQLTAVLESSIGWDPTNYLRLAEDMEEREGHYYSVLGTRKLAVESIDVIVEAASDDAADVKIADAVREMMALDCVDQSRADLLDALGKSYSVGGIRWDTSEKQWQPMAIEYMDPTWFMFDRATLRELRLRDEADPINGLQLKPARYIVHRPRLKSGLPIRNGLARIAAFAFICKAYALKDWLAFCEVFGMPVRVGKYGANASAKDVATLRRAVANIGTDAACVIPESMKIDFVESAKGNGGADVFERLCNYLDRQMSKIVLGQTMTADAQSTGLGSNNASVHNEVRGDIRDADCKQLATTYQHYLVKPFVDLNFGPQKKYPKIIIKQPDPEDLKQLTDSLAALVPLGLEVEQSVVRDKLGLPDPAVAKEGDAPIKLLKPQTTAAIPPADRLDEPTDPAQAIGAPRRATNSRQPQLATQDEIDNLVDLAMDGWEEQMSPIVGAVEKLAQESADEKEFLQKLPLLLGEVEPSALVAALASATFKARGLGDATDKTQV
ncbi:DUF935 domain-containing protein [Solimonas flava]|uniref:DUF935 domain-containing protein n=1 Tax=Solimonas flava TaxID=415849 RepID=UPI000423FA9D|nr:DUF935 domain-containing protein [Solimonas flava]